VAPRATLTVRLTDDAELRDLNRRFLGSDEPTDVLAFPGTEDPQLRGRHVGDIAISVERAQAQAAESTVDELRLLAIHGVLHCLGHDHDSASRATAMTEVTRSLLPDQRVPELLGP